MIDIDEQPLTVGKYIGYSPDSVAAADPEYLVWLYDNSTEKPCTKYLRDICEMDIIEDEYELANEYELD